MVLIAGLATEAEVSLGMVIVGLRGGRLRQAGEGAEGRRGGRRRSGGLDYSALRAP